MSDALMGGCRFRTFKVLDDFNREALGIGIGLNLSVKRVGSLEIFFKYEGIFKKNSREAKES